MSYITTVPVRYVFHGINRDRVSLFVDAWDPCVPMSMSIGDVSPDVVAAYNGVDCVIAEAVVDLAAEDISQVIVSYGAVLEPVSDDDFAEMFDNPVD